MNITPSITTNQFEMNVQREFDYTDKMYMTLMENVERDLNQLSKLSGNDTYLTESVFTKIKDGTKKFFACIIGSNYKLIKTLQKNIELATTKMTFKASVKAITVALSRVNDSAIKFPIYDFDAILKACDDGYKETMKAANKVFDTEYESVHEMYRDIEDFKYVKEKFCKNIVTNILDKKNRKINDKFIRYGSAIECSIAYRKMADGADEAFNRMMQWTKEIEDWKVKIGTMKVKTKVGGEAVLGKKIEVVENAVATVTDNMNKSYASVINATCNTASTVPKQWADDSFWETTIPVINKPYMKTNLVVRS